MEQGLYYDFYGELLTKHQQALYEAAVCLDMSLSEIAEEYGISRQGVHDVLKRCDKQLLAYENKLHLMERFSKVKEKAETILRITEEEQIRQLTQELIEEL